MTLKQKLSKAPQMHRKMVRGGAVCAIALIAMGSLTGCRSDEEDRVIGFEPGVYQGKQDTALSQETLDTLRSRASFQETP